MDSIRNSCDVSFKSSHIYFDYLTVLDLSKKGGASPHPPPTARADFDYFPPFFCCKVRTTRADFDWFPPFFCCRGRGTKVRPFYVKWADISTFRPGAQCPLRGTFPLIFNSFKNVYFQLVRLIEGILHIVWAEKTFFLIFWVRCCYCNFWMPKKSQNSTFFLKSSSIHCWWVSTKTLTVLYKKSLGW